MFIIDILTPQGFCYGVIKAINSLKKIVQENPNKKIYLLGWLVHNQKVIDEIINLGIILIDDRNESRYDAILNLPKVKNSILILSAHGTSKKVIEIAKSKNFEIIDLICKYVQKTHEIIEMKINEGFQIIFIGKKFHQETIAIKLNYPKINLIENIPDLKRLDKSKRYFCTNQTTLSIYDFAKIKCYLLNSFKNIEIQNDICNATTIRQEQVMRLNSTTDLLIVVGDPRSSNSTELFKIGSAKIKNTYFINSVNEINKKWFINIKKVSITSGSSTPSYLTHKIIEEIKVINEN